MHENMRGNMRVRDNGCRKRSSLEGLAGEIFELVARGSTLKQCRSGFGCFVEHAAANGNNRPPRADRGWTRRECGMDGL